MWCRQGEVAVVLQQFRRVGLVAAGLMVMASPSWGQYYDNRSPNTTVYTSPALGGNSGGYSSGGAGYGGGYGAAAAPEAVPADAAGRVEVRLQALEEQLRRLTGRLEESQHQVTVLKDRLERMQADMEVRFKEMTPAAAAPATSPRPQGGTAAAPPPGRGESTLGTLPQHEADAIKLQPPVKAGLPAGSAKEQYDYAFNLVRTDYAQAEVALKEFIAKHPNDALTGSAQYWLGETYYVRNDFQQAAVSFLNAYQKFPKGAKAPDSLLKLGLSLASLGKKGDGCVALAKMLKDYPQAAETLKRRATTERGKMGCN